MSLLVIGSIAVTLAHGGAVLDAPTALKAHLRHSSSTARGYLFDWTPPSDPTDMFCASRSALTLLSGGSFQTSYHFQMFSDSSLTKIIFDSGRVLSNQTMRVSFPALDSKLASHHRDKAVFWRVRSFIGLKCASTWSPVSVMFSTTTFSDDAKPIWGPPSARYVFLRTSFPMPSNVVGAHAMVTASQSNGQEKLLGAYRLYVNGRVVGIGPGRGDTAVGAPNHTQFDVIELSGLLSSTVSIGLQCYSGASNGGKVILQLVFTKESGETVTVSSNSSWKAFDATSYYGPNKQTTGGAYDAPQEHIDASKYPGNWTSPTFDDSSWVAATEQSSFGFTIMQKETDPLVVAVDVQPPILQKLPGNYNGYFFDYQTEVMAGISLKVNPNIGANFAELTLSEELSGPYGSGNLLYPMRTGNHYKYIFTLDSDKQSLIELHEYALFRYGTVFFCSKLNLDGTCPKPGPPGPPPPPPLAMCGTASEQQNLMLGCPDGANVASIGFASYGTPTGNCTGTGSLNGFKVNAKCNADNSVSVLAKLCVGKSKCSIEVGNNLFVGCTGCLPDGDPCHETTKWLSAAVQCGKSSDISMDDDQFSLSAWTVRYPWEESDSSFSSSDSLLNDVYELCRNTLRVTSLDTTTDSNTRERLPYEADGFITGSSRFSFQREQNWQLHSSKHNFVNPTWPTEWRQFMPLMAYEHWMQSGELTLAKEFWDLLVNSTQIGCINTTNNLVDFSRCPRMPGTRDIVDWPMGARDGYVMTDTNTVINAFAVGGLRALAEMAIAMGDTDVATSLTKQANATEFAIESLLFNSTSGLMVDGLYGAQKHSAWHAQTNTLWFKTVPEAAKSKILAWLLQRRVVGSVYAVYSFLQALYAVDSDHGVAALQMLTQCDDNSWCHMLNVNATATMEAWTRVEKPNLSWSHPWASAPASAIVRGLIGLMPSAPGFSTWIVKPQPGNLTYFTSRSPSLPGYFNIAVNQTKSTFDLTLGAPSNTHGTACIPKLGSESTAMTVDGAVMQGYAKSDYICIDGITGSRKPHVISRSVA